MSLRLRLSLTIGAVFVLIWTIAATWMLCDLRGQMLESLDTRLAASARMVAGLVNQLPMPEQGNAPMSASPLDEVDALACQVSSLRGEVLVRSQSTPEELAVAKDGGFHDQIIEGEHWRTFTLTHGDLRITTADRQQERDALQRSLLLAASLPVSLALLSSLGLLWVGVGRGLEPLNRMRAALKQRDADSVEPLNVAGMPSELQPLVDTQNQLFQRIAQALERERRLTGDAAHELRSPLTAIKTHLQVARLTEGDARDQSLAHAEEGTDRLHRTLEQLLLLARVEGSLSFDEGVQHGAAEIAQLAIHDVEQGQRWRIALHHAPNFPELALAVPSGLAIAALRNLLENAVRHTQTGSAVELTLGLRENQACFQVRDHGGLIADEDLERLTQRFWRRGSGTGSGLGLAIVQAIVQRCGGSLTFDNQSDGLRVELRLPLRRGPVAAVEKV